MSASFQDLVRRVVPRWRNFSDAIARRELDPAVLVTGQAIEVGDFLREKELAWSETREIGFALDLVNAASVLGVSEPAKGAAEFILENQGNVSALGLRIAAKVLGVSDATSRAPQTTSREITISEIRTAKARSVEEPRNAFAWAELARLYTLLGMPRKGLRPMRIALGLAPNERFIIRSASRYLLHIDEPDEALSLLRKSQQTESDPWLMSAELAISSVVGKSPRFWREAANALQSGDFSQFHLSELAASVASIELWDGRDRRAREGFEQALQAPTENALAQVVWASRKLGIEPVALSKIQFTGAFEAEALNARNRSEWDVVVEKCREWAVDEAFSSRPFGLSSAVSATLRGKPDEGAAIAAEGLATNRNHPGLINNLAFALVEAGRPVDANVELLKADLVGADLAAHICLLATSGLIAYRLGEAEKGKALYEATIRFAVQNNQPLFKAAAQLYLAREEALANRSGYEKIFGAGAEYIAKFGDSYSRAVVAVIREQIDSHHKRSRDRGVLM